MLMVTPTVRVQLEQQDRINRIIHGQESGHYYLLIGEKVPPSPLSSPRLELTLAMLFHQGTGKTSMLLE